MRKTVRQQLLPVLLPLVFTCFALCGQAQCTYKVINLKNDTLSIAVPNDFPVMEKTGNAASDSSSFWSAFQVWNQSSEAIRNTSLPTASTSGVFKVYFEIPASVFAAFTDDRKLALAAYPQLFVVLQ